MKLPKILTDIGTVSIGISRLSCNWVGDPNDFTKDLKLTVDLDRTTESANEQPKDIDAKPNPRTSTSSYPNETPYPSRLTRGRFLYQQVRSQFSHDIWWLSLTVLFIAIAESDHFKSDPIPFATFNIIFEVVSAYSCVGASIGYPDKTYAFCGRWHTFSKLLLVAVSLKGRLRGVSIAANKSASLLEEWKNSRKDTSKKLSSCV